MIKDNARIFISYARSDGKEIAGQLRDDLEEAGLKVWQDLVAMEGGKDWWRQIASAIQHEALEYLVLVMTPQALASHIVYKEWRLARQEGKCVLPIIGSRDLNFDAMPGWMKVANFINVKEPEQWTRMLRTLEGPCDQERVPFMVEELPPEFVLRPDEFEDLVGKLLAREEVSAVAITAALRGAGGYGKTTLARALCHDEPKFIS